MTSITIQTAEFARQFQQMSESVQDLSMITICSDKRIVGAFISPAMMEELELLRRRRRELTRIEEADNSFVEALDDAVATYDDPE
jgi:succinate dehydrogenase/fumarate reductase-like Fe-S protein